jgi:two-component system response regulator YesN
MQSTSDSNHRGYRLYSDFYKFLSLLEEKREIDPRFLKVHALMLEIEKNYSQNLKISQYAKTLLTSESSLRSLFKEYTGYSIIDYRNRLRVERANELILDGMKSGEAALAVGFSSPAFYCRMCKKYKI